MAVDTIDLDPQDGDMYVFKEIERAFALKLTQADVGHWRTVGDMHRTLTALLGDRRGDTACATAMAFYRLRAALGGRESGITPRTPLAPLAAPHPRRWRLAVERSSGLRLPPFVMTWPGQIGCLAAMGAMLGILADVMLQSGWLALGSAGVLAAGILACRIDRLKVPTRLSTFGDLATSVARANAGALAAQGARLGERDIWDALCAILSEETGVAADSMGPDSHLFRHPLKQDRQAA